MGNHYGSFALQLQIRKLFHSSAWSPISFFQAGKRCPSTKLCEIEQQIVIIKATFYFVKWSRGFRAAMLWLIGQLLCNCHTSIWPVRTQGVQMDSDIYYLGSESNASIASAPCLCTSLIGWHWTAGARWQVVLPVGSLFPSAAISKLQASSSTDTEACSCCLWGGGHEVDPVLNWDERDGWETVLSPSTTKQGAGGEER